MTQAITRFSAILVSYHSGAILDACLKALIGAPLCGQIVLVNNGNSTEISARLRAMPELTLIEGQGNIGFGRACNLGAASATEALLVFVNPDCLIDAATLPAFHDALRQFPDALIGGALRNEDGSEQRGSRRGELTPWSALISFAGLGKAGPAAGVWRDFNRMLEPFPSQVTPMPVISGALFAARTETFEAVDGFDPAFVLHVEDVDLCRRVRASGRHVMFAPQATGLHIGGTSAVSSWQVERAKIASFGYYFWKHARTFVDYLSVIMVMPLLTGAVLARAIMRR
jgi:N-acetylglucosaminyl-diphospho-decaprenol L-rhamnosyltransferase